MRTAVRAALAVLLLGAGLASATTLLKLDVTSLTRHSDVVLRGKVTRVAPRWTMDHKRIMTDADIEVLETLKGTPAATVTAMQPGGEIGEVGQRVYGAARFAPGEEVVVFLEQRGTRYTVTGMMQGRYVVSRPKDGAATASQQFDDGSFVDPQTGQPTASAAQTIDLKTLLTQVRTAAADPVKPEPTRPGPVTPVTK